MNNNETLLDYAKQAIKTRIAHIDGELEMLQREATNPHVAQFIALLKQAKTPDELFKLMETGLPDEHP